MLALALVVLALRLVRLALRLLERLLLRPEVRLRRIDAGLGVARDDAHLLARGLDVCELGGHLVVELSQG